jgi:PAS domain S-box-containing protein
MELEVAALEPMGGERLVFETTSDAIFSVDLETSAIASANRRLEELTGYPVATLLGAEADLLCPDPETTDRSAPFGPSVWEHAGLYEDVALGRADGFATTVTMRVGHTVAQRRHLAICVVRDETERRMLERELITKHVALRSAHEELERRVHELRRMSEALEERQRELGELSARIATVSRRAMLAEVVAEVAHSMNNPLAALWSSIRLLGRSVSTTADSEARERGEVLVRRCQDACGRMAQVVEELRQACRSSAPTNTAAAIDIGDQIAATLSLLSHRIGRSVRVEVEVEPGLRAHAVADEVHHVLSNVLDNALQAVGASGTIRVEACGEGDSVLVAVSDTGPGVAPAIAEAIFEPFFTTKPRGQGTGLGLSMVRRIVTRYGGGVDLLPSGPLGGATFRIRLRRET